MAASNVRQELHDVRYGIRMHSALLDAIEQAAAAEYTSAAEYIRRTLADKLKARKAADGPAKKRAT
jgi:hypothetical protein